jgi:2,3-dihydro-2,3-dihydroxybenzoate dehydrogenase
MSTAWDFAGKQVWVTGAGQGIGLHTARAFQQAGAMVTGFDKPSAVRITLFAPSDGYHRQSGGRGGCQRLLAEQPVLDVLVNGAGILRLGATDEISDDDWQSCLAVNAGGAFNLFRHTLPVFRRQQHGAIVSIASNAAHVPRVGMSAYCASKAALRSLCLTVGLEMAPFGVRCNLVSPVRPLRRCNRPCGKRTTPNSAPSTGFRSVQTGHSVGKIACRRKWLKQCAVSGFRERLSHAGYRYRFARNVVPESFITGAGC